VTPDATPPTSEQGPACACRISFSDPLGHCLRPLVLFAQVARRSGSAVTLSRGGRRADGKNPAEVLALGAARGLPLRLDVVGPDAAATLTALLMCPFVAPELALEGGADGRPGIASSAPRHDL
jgi:phosphotransferase system HPr-like phosphotransfer protein